MGFGSVFCETSSTHPSTLLLDFENFPYYSFTLHGLFLVLFSNPACYRHCRGIRVPTVSTSCSASSGALLALGSPSGQGGCWPLVSRPHLRERRRTRPGDTAWGPPACTWGLPAFWFLRPVNGCVRSVGSELPSTGVLTGPLADMGDAAVTGCGKEYKAGYKTLSKVRCRWPVPTPGRNRPGRPQRLRLAGDHHHPPPLFPPPSQP